MASLSGRTAGPCLFGALGGLFGRDDFEGAPSGCGGEFGDWDAGVTAGTLSFHLAAIDAHLDGVYRGSFGFGGFLVRKQDVVGVGCHLLAALLCYPCYLCNE